MPPPLSGFHHVTAIAGPPQPNVAFYTGVLGLRLVKRTVNFDDPGTYHLYYGDALGRPGTILTFFPWSNAVPGRVGAGMASATAFSVSAGSVDAWMEYFADRALDFDAPHERFGDAVLPFPDPDGLMLELVAHDGAEGLPAPPEGPLGEHGLRGFHSVTLASGNPEATARVLTDVFGWNEQGEEDGRLRFRASDGGLGSVVDVVPSDATGRGAAGTFHHVAFRTRDEQEQRAWQEVLLEAGLMVTEIRDRQYFRSIYFREPGGVLFELATDGPGFATDEPEDALGTALQLPPWLEKRRPTIEARLPDLTLPTS
jgi:catechol 2,3-dioxygenase-like lactoylglutathione lyase family enzyme